MNNNMIPENYNQTNDKIDLLRKELKITRIFCIINTVAVTLLLIGMIVLFMMLKPLLTFVESASATLDQLSVTLEKLDMDAVNEGITSISESLGQINWEELMGSLESLESIDMEELNETLQGLDSEELTEALENMNNVSDFFSGVGEDINEGIDQTFGGFDFSSLFGSDSNDNAEDGNN